MKPLLRTIFALAIIVVITTLHIAWIMIFPYPFNTLNVIIIALVYLLLMHRIAVAIAMAFIAGITIELYAVTPFGLLLGALLLALLVSAFFASRVLTTNSFWGSVTLCLFMVVINRLAVMAFLFVMGFVQGEGGTFSLQLLESMVAEGVMTTLTAAVLFALLPLPHRTATVRIATPYGILR